MKMRKTDQNAVFTIVIILAFIGLVFLGIKLMVESRQIYDQSYQQAVRLEEKVLDTSIKKAITIVPPSYASIRDGYSQALSFFMLALGAMLLLLLLPRLQNLSIGPGGINLTLKDLQQNVDALIRQKNSEQATSVGEGGGKNSTRMAEVKESIAAANKEYPDDPQKGKWGGLAENNFRKLSANVTPSQWEGFYIVTLEVESTNQGFPLQGIVKYHLHNTFRNPDPVIAVKNNKAVLNLTKVYGAFTVGAETDEGDTKLELDLAELKDAPKEFRER